MRRAAAALLAALCTAGPASADCGLDGLLPTTCILIERDIARVLTGQPSPGIEIQSIDTDTGAVRYVFQGVTGEVRLGEGGVPEIDYYLSFNSGKVLVIEIGPEAVPEEAELRLMFPGGTGLFPESLPATVRPEMGQLLLADTLAIRGVAEGVAGLTLRRLELAGVDQLRLHYDAELDSGDTILIRVLRQMPEGSVPLFLVDGGRPSLAHSEGASPTCDAAAFDDPERGCLATSFAIGSAYHEFIYGSAVWLGGRYVLTSRHISPNDGWADLEVFSGYDFSDPADARPDLWRALHNEGPGTGKRIMAFAVVNDPRNGRATRLVVLKLDAPPTFLVDAPPAPPLLVGDHREQLRQATLFGAGFGLTGEAAVAPGRRRKGRMSVACLPADSATDVRCGATETLMLLRHDPERGGTASYACDLDSGSPAFVQAGPPGEERLVLVGILETSVDDSLTCAPASYYVDLTPEWMQRGLRNAVLQLETLSEDGVLPEGVLPTLDADPVALTGPILLAGVNPLRRLTVFELVQVARK